MSVNSARTSDGTGEKNAREFEHALRFQLVRRVALPADCWSIARSRRDEVTGSFRNGVEEGSETRDHNCSDGWHLCRLSTCCGAATPTSVCPQSSSLSGNGSPAAWPGRRRCSPDEADRRTASTASMASVIVSPPLPRSGRRSGRGPSPPTASAPLIENSPRHAVLRQPNRTKAMPTARSPDRRRHRNAPCNATAPYEIHD